MRMSTGTWIRRSMGCGLVVASLGACGRSERPAAADTTVPPATTTSEQSAGTTAADVQIAVAQKPAVGSYLTDAKGRSVYLFLKDTSSASSCYDACAAAWPPVIVTGRPVPSDTAVKTELLGTSQRRDGAMQATYKNVPLYYYEDDKQPGDIEGQDKFEFGAKWYLVSPAGGKQESKTKER
jgi:predicted lipoprotein with Yx(FWY)xxD motif